MARDDEQIDYDLEALLMADGAWHEENGYVVELSAKAVNRTASRPHGIDYALVFRPVDGKPIVKFDNAHAVERKSGRFVKRSPDNDHWHRGERDTGRPYKFVSCHKLLEDFYTEIARVKNERGIK